MPYCYFRELREFLMVQIAVVLPDGFKASDKYLLNWSKRSDISIRRITHHGQVGTQTMAQKQRIMLEFFQELKWKTRPN